jgi:hypothetical protein
MEGALGFKYGAVSAMILLLLTVILFMILIYVDMYWNAEWLVFYRFK